MIGLYVQRWGRFLGISGIKSTLNKLALQHPTALTISNVQESPIPIGQWRYQSYAQHYGFSQSSSTNTEVLVASCEHYRVQGLVKCPILGSGHKIRLFIGHLVVVFEIIVSWCLDPPRHAAVPRFTIIDW